MVILLPILTAAQIPKRAITIADSICKTRVLCPNTWIVLNDSIFYPRDSTKQNKTTEIYFFTYEVHLTDDIITDLSISIEENFNIKYISGLPDKGYRFSACRIMPRKQLWEIAKANGLKTKFKRCNYYMEFNDDGIFIRLHERKTKCNLDFYYLNAISGAFVRHAKMNVCF